MAKIIQPKGRFWRIIKRFFSISLIGLFLLVVFEVIYRNQWIDTYRNSLVGLNEEAELKKEARTILVLGDSFSASKDGWVKKIREKLPAYRVVNSAVSGTGIVQANIIAHKRFKEFKPDILIYQIYVGNDLIDYRYPIAWSKVNPFRNLYWWWAHKFRSVAYLNQAMGQIFPGKSPEEVTAIFNEPFDIGKYNGREKMLLKAEPDFVENQVFLEGGREKDMVGYLKRLDDILARCEANGTVVYLLVLPHCAQVNSEYKVRMQQLGADFRLAWHTRADYPFVNKLAGHTQGRATVLNPLADMQSASINGAPMYYNNDPHLTPQAQSWLGNWVWLAIQSSLAAIPSAQ